MTPEHLHEQARQRPRQVCGLTLDQLHALPPAEVVARARAVRTAVRRLYVEHRQLTEANAAVDEILDENALSLSGAKSFVAVTGPNLAGKSTFARQWFLERYRNTIGPEALNFPRPPEWMPDDQTDAQYVPMAWVNLASAALRGSLSLELLAAIGLDVVKPPPTHRLVGALRRCGTRLIVLDDMHFLRTHKQLGREALDHIKKLNNELGEYGGTIVMVGADLESTELWDDRQITGRLQAIELTRFTDTTAEDRINWQRVLKGFETDLLPLFPASPPAVLSQGSAGLLLRRTQGSIRDLHELLVAAARQASDDASWAITPQLLERTELDTSLSAHTRHETAAADARQKRPARRRTSTDTTTNAATSAGKSSAGTSRAS